jgi:hypothetical protein
VPLIVFIFNSSPDTYLALTALFKENGTTKVVVPLVVAKAGIVPSILGGYNFIAILTLLSSRSLILVLRLCLRSLLNPFLESL